MKLRGLEMTNIKENIQYEIRNYLIGSPLSEDHVEHICAIVKEGFESYPSAVHPDTSDEKRWDNADFDVDMARDIWDN
jgi:hypothetical protein